MAVVTVHDSIRRGERCEAYRVATPIKTIQVFTLSLSTEKGTHRAQPQEPQKYVHPQVLPWVVSRHIGRTPAWHQTAACHRCHKPALSHGVTSCNASVMPLNATFLATHRQLTATATTRFNPCKSVCRLILSSGLPSTGFAPSSCVPRACPSHLLQPQSCSCEACRDAARHGGACVRLRASTSSPSRLHSENNLA